MHEITFALVTPTEDVCLQCATSLLRLQQSAARRADVHLNVHIVSSLLEALNLSVPSPATDGAAGRWLVIVDGSAGFPDEFIYQAITSAHDMVLGVYPLAKVDWERVNTCLTDEEHTEPTSHTGNVYNLTPKNASFTRYVQVDDIQEAKIMCISTSALKKLSGPHTSYTKPSPGHLYTHDSVFVTDKEDRGDRGDRGGVEDIEDIDSQPIIMQQSNPYQTLFRRFVDIGLSVVADIEHQCINSGNAQFAGCVGRRGFVR